MWKAAKLGAKHLNSALTKIAFRGTAVQPATSEREDMIKWKSRCLYHASTSDLKDLTTDVAAEGACQHEHAACCLLRRP